MTNRKKKDIKSLFHCVLDTQTMHGKAHGSEQL